MRVLHILHTSIPNLCGYSIRSDYITRFQQEQGIEPGIVTSAQQPGSTESYEEFRGMPYWRTPALGRALPPLLREYALIRSLQKTIQIAIKQWQPDIIHAHSPVLVSLPAMRAAQQAKIPFVYEVRDLWENASVDRGKFSYDSPFYRLARAMDTRVLKRADATVTICRSLEQVLAPRVRSKEGLFVVDNGVDTLRFTPTEPAAALRTRWNLDGKKIIAYIGTFQPYEGLSTLISAMTEILQKVPSAHLLIVGSGGELSALQKQVEQDSLGSNVTFTGRLEHSDVADAYSLADVMVYPRILTRTTALTTPLKPLEAMAMGKAVIVSDVPAMKELVSDGVTGLTFRAGDVNDLADKCCCALRGGDVRRVMETAARNWVMQQREWSQLVARYQGIYNHAYTASRN